MNPNLYPPIILVVDDDESFRSATASLLRSCDWTVRAYASAIDFLAEINRGDVCLVISDVQMPVMDGFTLLKQINALVRRIPVILITAYATRDMIDKIGCSGAAGFFLKPLDDVRFLAQVKEIVNIPGR